MKVEINHRQTSVKEECQTLAQLLSAEGFSGKGQAVAVNNRVVPKSEWHEFRLADGMKITVISAVCGG